MSLTQAQESFGGITEGGINDLLREVFTARPHYLHYGSGSFVPTSTVSATHMNPIPFPYLPSGIDWSVEFSIPVVDLYPETSSLPPQLTMTAGQLSVTTKARLCIACASARDLARQNPDAAGKPQGGKIKPVCCDLEVYALGHLEDTFGPDAESVVVIVDAIELVDIKPDPLESAIECLMLQILRAILENVKLPLSTLRAGAFSLTIVHGPEIADNEIKVYGNV